MRKTTDAIIFYKNTLAKTNNDWLKALCMVNINKLGMQYWNFEYKKKDYWNPVS
jgi:hypothetical protein|tara:strand:+ start:1701 stop:1862 length:162 start_codon:yes stop_codon:yes gene_type:complete